MLRLTLILASLMGLFLSSSALAMVEVDPSSKSGKIRGVILDNTTNEAVEYATIALYKESDSSLVTGTISDFTGHFKIDDLEFGSYYLKISFIGYENKITNSFTLSEGNDNQNLGEIYIVSLAEELEEFEVLGEKKAIEYRIDKKIINVDKQITSEGGTAVDVLENNPSIQVDVEGNVTLRGSSGFTVLIDGRPTILEPSDILRQIPSSSIENIEIITNPSAKYNPDGATGIINIITKKSPFEGLSGIANVTAGRFGEFGADIQLNYRVNKFNFILSADYDKRYRPAYTTNNRLTFKNDTTTYLDAYGNTDRERLTSRISGGIEYEPTKNDFVAVSAGYGSWKMNSNSTIRYDEYTDPLYFDFSFNSVDQVLRGGDYFEIDGYYQHVFPKKEKNTLIPDSLSSAERKGFRAKTEHKLKFEVNYQYRNIDEESTNQLSSLENELFAATKNIENGPSESYQYNLDYTLPLRKEDKLEAGLQYRMGTSVDNTELWLFNNSTGIIEQIPAFSNSIDYFRNIGSAYLIYAGVQKKFGYQLGIRTEYTDRKIAVGDTATYTIDRWDYFPTIHLSYDLGNDQQIMASYSRRIERPRSWWLEPFVTWQDAYNVRQGNPSLKPEYIDSFDFGYIKEFGNNFFSLEGYYRVTHNVVSRVQSIYIADVLLTKPENVGEDYSLGIEAMLSLRLTKWWNMDISGNLFNYRMDGELIYSTNEGDVAEKLDRESTNWNSRLNNTFSLWKNGVFQLNSRYNSASINAQGTSEGFFTLDAAFKVSFFEKSLTANLQARNLLGTAVREYSVEGFDFNSYYKYEPRYPSVSLTLAYRFNNFKNNRRGGGGDGGSGDEF
jgi:outer membrane receptor protein involved in Fe transport